MIWFLICHIFLCVYTDTIIEWYQSYKHVRGTISCANAMSTFVWSISPQQWSHFPLQKCVTVHFLSFPKRVLTVRLKQAKSLEHSTNAKNARCVCCTRSRTVLSTCAPQICPSRWLLYNSHCVQPTWRLTILLLRSHTLVHTKNSCLQPTQKHPRPLV